MTTVPWGWHETPTPEQVREWFQAQTIPGDDGCVLWTKRIKPAGYGSARFPRPWAREYGVSYEQTALWLGTRSENMRDAVAKGRHVSGFQGKFRKKAMA